jgi:hypothetical protein
MGRFADVIRCNILEKYMSSYMRERNVDALLVLRNEDKWAMTGNFYFLSFGKFVSCCLFSISFLFYALVWFLFFI